MRASVRGRPRGSTPRHVTFTAGLPALPKFGDGSARTLREILSSVRTVLLPLGEEGGPIADRWISKTARQLELAVFGSDDPDHIELELTRRTLG